MLRRPNFWTEEGESPLLELEHGYLRNNAEAVLARTAAWPGLCGVPADESDAITLVSPAEHSYIIKRDADRTFVCESQRELYRVVLSTMDAKLNDYGQGMGYACSFLLLFFEPVQVARMLYKLATDPKYIPGYWRAEAVAFNVDAIVFGRMMANFFPDVQAKLSAKIVMPQTFCQKWFCGLALHMLHFEALLDFWEAFLAQGYEFLFKFALAMTVATREALLAAESASEIYAILRLENASDEMRAAVMHEALNLAVDGAFSETIIALRDDVMTNEVGPALAAAAKYNAERALENENSAGSCSEDEASGCDCEACTNLVPEFYCPTCDLLLCARCQDKAARGVAVKSHAAGHEIKPANVKAVLEKRRAAVDALAGDLAALSVSAGPST